jgi:hypothetical protein
VDAALRFLGRILEVVEPDVERAVVDLDAVEVAARRHRERFADLDAGLAGPAGRDVDADEAPEQVAAVEPHAARDVGLGAPGERRRDDRGGGG